MRRHRRDERASEVSNNEGKSLSVQKKRAMGKRSKTTKQKGVEARKRRAGKEILVIRGTTRRHARGRDRGIIRDHSYGGVVI